MNYVFPTCISCIRWIPISNHNLKDIIAIKNVIKYIEYFQKDNIEILEFRNRKIVHNISTYVISCRQHFSVYSEQQENSSLSLVCINCVTSIVNIFSICKICPRVFPRLHAETFFRNIQGFYFIVET